ncbi:murein hydrolase transporter LrgA [Alteromonas sp. KUL49]|nr:murein hydrolase transporter LrgA [Alteromonas sp. KUL49]
MLLKKLITGLVGASVILACYWLGLFISDIFHLAVPGAVCGLMMLLILLFVLPSIKDSVAFAAQPLLSHMSLLFIPVVMGVGVYWTNITDNITSLAIAVVVTTCLVLGIQAKLTVWLMADDESETPSNIDEKCQ